ncbi:MAG: hypothetical protein RIM84_13180 [Alphaproteobacteria bacterium]
MTVDRFRASLDAEAPPDGLSQPLLALWHAGRGEWDAAHGVAQADKSAEAAWVHAHLHRIEGDLNNAGYWYRRAGRAQSEADIPQEWAEIVAALQA